MDPLVRTDHSQLFTAEQWRRIDKALALSPRQSEILRMVFGSRSDKQIASELGIAHSTVRMHLQRLYAKCGVSDRVELVLHVVGLMTSE